MVRSLWSVAVAMVKEPPAVGNWRHAFCAGPSFLTRHSSLFLGPLHVEGVDFPDENVTRDQRRAVPRLMRAQERSALTGKPRAKPFFQQPLFERCD